MDLNKLTPAPWSASDDTYDDRWNVLDAFDWSFMGVSFHPDCPVKGDEESTAKFVALARNAFDVMMRRGWHVESFSLLGGGKAWRIPMALANDMIRQHGANAAGFGSWARLHKANDPFTTLVEADKWYRENVENPTGNVSS